MAIVERINAELQRRWTLDDARRVSQEALRPQLEEKYRKEFPRERALQGVLLGELRELALVGLVEEVIGRRVLSVAEHDRRTILRARRRGIEENSLFVRARKLQLQPPRGDWSVAFPYPTISYETGEWNTDLRMIVATGDPLFDEQLVMIRYSPRRELTIRGEETTFAGQIPQDPKERLGVFENALVAAFVDPFSAGLRQDYPINVEGFVPRDPLNLSRT